MRIGSSSWVDDVRSLKKLRRVSISEPDVSILGLSKQKSSPFSADLREKSVIPLCADVTKKDDLTRIAETVRKDIGYINLLVANAGMTGPTLTNLKSNPTISEFVSYVWKTSSEEFNAVYDLNCTAVFHTIVAFLELLDKGNKTTYSCKSQVVATASTASFLRQPRAGFAYTSSKAALVSMMKSLSSFCVPWGIRFNSLAAGREFSLIYCVFGCRFITRLQVRPAPSTMNFGLTSDLSYSQKSTVFASDLSEPLFAPFRISKTKASTEEGVFSKSYQPAERAGSEDDMAGAIIYLASPAGSFCNGSVMLLDGGKLGTMPATY